LVKPVRAFERDKIVRRDGSSIERNKQIISDQPTRQRGTEDRLKPVSASNDSKPKRTVREIESGGIRHSPKSVRSTNSNDRGTVEKETQIERKEIRKTVREQESIKPSEKTNKPTQVKRNENPKPQPKAERVKTSEKETKRTNEGSVKKESARSGNNSSTRTSSGSKSQGKRR